MKLRIFLKYLVPICLCMVLFSCGTGRNAVSRAKKVPSQSESTKKEEAQVKPETPVEYPSKVVEAIIKEAHKWIGTPYVYGGHSKSGTDCSGMVMEVYLAAADLKLPRSARDQQAYCSEVHRSKLVPGDLIFFRTGSGPRVTHVGIYIGNDKMIHASSSRGVIISNLNERYYVTHFHSCGTIDNLKSKKTSTEVADRQKSKDKKAEPSQPVKQSVKAKAPENVREVSLDELERVLDAKSDSILNVFME